MTRHSASEPPALVAQPQRALAWFLVFALGLGVAGGFVAFVAALAALAASLGFLLGALIALIMTAAFAIEWVAAFCLCG